MKILLKMLVADLHLQWHKIYQPQNKAIQLYSASESSKKKLEVHFHPGEHKIIQQTRQERTDT